MTAAIKTSRNDGILEITLDRPKANAIDRATSHLMGQAFSTFRDDDDLRVAILAGGGEKFFSAGWDLNEAAEVGGEGYNGDYGQGGLYGFPELPRLEKPVICAVNGYAIGAGFEALLGADFVIAAEHAQMWLPEAQLGLAPDVGTFRLPRMLPPVIANDVLYAGRKLTAQDALQWGLVNQIVPQARLMDAARDLAVRIMEAAPLSVAAVKQTARLSRGMSISQCYEAMRNGDFPMFSRMTESADAQEGLRAAAAKRDPVWKGC